jgi:hypothetical protein
VTGSPDEVYVELVQGLGEALVSGEFPGRALGGSVSRTALDAALQSGALASSGGAAGGGQGGLAGSLMRALGAEDGGEGAGGGSFSFGGPPPPPLEDLRRFVRVACYPSKSHALLAPSPGAGVVMARSDSNAGGSGGRLVVAGREGLQGSAPPSCVSPLTCRHPFHP